MLKRFPMALRAAARRSVFKDRVEAFAAYKGRGAFKSWPEARGGRLRGRRPARPRGPARWSCPARPAWEAVNYTAQGADPYAALRRIKVPVRILKAEHGSTCRLEPRKGLRPNVRR